MWTEASWATTLLDNPNTGSGVYLCFGRAMAYMNSAWVDAHGAGAQRSDPKGGSLSNHTYVPNGYFSPQAPQGDAIRIYTHIRLVRDVAVSDSWRFAFVGDMHTPLTSIPEEIAAGDRMLFRVPGTHESFTFVAWLRVAVYQEFVTALLVTEESRRWQGLENGQPPVALAELPYLPLRWELRNDGQLALNWQRANPSTGKGWHIHWADTDLKPGRLGTWTLLATVVDSARREVVHYVNGREVARRPAMIESPFALTRLCLGNMSTTEAEAKAGIRYGFVGRMDEVIVANRAFSDTEIQRLYETGRP